MTYAIGRIPGRFAYNNGQPEADGGWCWFQDPRAVYHEGARRQVYMGFVTADGSIGITAIDLDDKTIARTILHPQLHQDDHAAPSIWVRPDGKVVVFYCKHNGINMYYRVSSSAEDVSAFDAEQIALGRDAGAAVTVSSAQNFTYPHLHYLPAEGSGDGRLYLFFRGGTPWAPTFSYSDDLGATWSQPRVMFCGPASQRPYFKTVDNGTDTIHVATTEGHPRDTVTNINHFKISGGNIYKSDGTLVMALADLPLQSLDTDPAPGAPTAADVTKVYDSTTSGRAWTWDIALDGSGYPVITYAAFVSNSDHRYRYARWTGSAWTDHEIVAGGGQIFEGAAEPNYSGGVVLDHYDPSIVYLARKAPAELQFEVETRTTADNGATWGAALALSGASGTAKQVRPVPVWGRGTVADCPAVIWMAGRYTTYNDWATALRCWPPLPV